MRTASLPILVLLPILAACGGSENAPPLVVERDSAGIRIVESAAPGWPAGGEWRVAPEPAVEIGLMEGETSYLLSQVEGAVRMSDGRIVVANRQTNELRIYDAAGGFVTATGGSGSGPGEYEYLRAVLRCGADSIFGFDLSWQMKVYNADGSFVRQQDLEAPGASTTPYALACGRNGVFVASGWGQPSMPEAPGFFRTTAPITLFRPGEDGVTLADTLSSERLASTGGTRPHPLGRSATMAVGLDAVYVATGETFGVGVYDLDGALQAIFRAPPEDVSIRDEHLAAYRTARLATLEERFHAEFERTLPEMAAPGAFPTFTRLVASIDGHLWAERFTPPGESGSRWAVFDPNGAFLGHVAMPEALEVTEIGTDYVLGIHRDELDVERVRLHAIQRLDPAL